ncbi:TetR/AcrR family transcriptional regulator [Microbacterium resistens]|uniref:TetR/AcrR family transcriptional regulator n=1 Tax=Microbacterium resistens TaxID=156977 RepID=A0ABY3RN16_9MICO|nr:TetR/AcrR family transcriptional regulator [Microbacterium resistens]MBW1638785.1 TetR/AcrR family transcriptional regulator [Microbacterium resistens]UGS25278.1 TetR/AcrR family transcriptional regulator [Microbacterium resistens]
MPRASADDAARTAQQILDAARALFAADGYAAVAVEDVARRVGATRGAVYHHYGNKAGLFEAVAARQQELVAAAVVAAADAAGDDPSAQLRAGSHAFLDAITDDAAVRVLLIEAPAVLGWQRWRQLDAQHSGAHLAEALAAAGVEPALREAMTAMLSGAMNEAALGLAARPGDAAARTAAHAALDRLLDAALG